MNPIEHTKNWLQTFVIGLNFCPFAKLPFERENIRYVLESEKNLENCLQTCVNELLLLQVQPEIETTLVIFDAALNDFHDYMDFLAVAESILPTLKLEGIFQIASFHPDYQFGGTQADDVSNYTNRSPYPMLHFLRESSVSWAVETHPNTEKIPTQNIERLEALGSHEVKKRWNDLDTTH